MPIDTTSTLRLSNRTYTAEEIYQSAYRTRTCITCGKEVLVPIPHGTPIRTVEAFDKVYRCQQCRTPVTFYPPRCESCGRSATSAHKAFWGRKPVCCRGGKS